MLNWTHKGLQKTLLVRPNFDCLQVTLHNLPSTTNEMKMTVCALHGSRICTALEKQHQDFEGNIGVVNNVIVIEQHRYTYLGKMP